MSFWLGLFIPCFFIWFIMLLLIPSMISLGPWRDYWVLFVMMIVFIFIFSLGKLITIRPLHKTWNIDLNRCLISSMMRNWINLVFRLFSQSNSFSLYFLHISFCDCLPGLIIVNKFSIFIFISYRRFISIILDYANIVKHFIIPLSSHTLFPQHLSFSHGLSSALLGKIIPWILTTPRLLSSNLIILWSLLH